MGTLNLPIAVWKDSQGRHTASLMTWDDDVIGYGLTKEKAIDQVKSDMIALSKKQSVEFDYLLSDESTSGVVEVEIRPEYSIGERVYPMQDVLPIEIPYFAGKSTIKGLNLCFLPTLNVAFDYFYEDEDSLDYMVESQAQSELKGLSLQDLAPYMVPRELSLESVNLRLKTVRVECDDIPAYRHLKEIATELDRACIRKTNTKPLFRDDLINHGFKLLNEQYVNLLFVGESGVGKTSVLAGIVSKFHSSKGNCNRSFWQSAPNRIIAGMRYLGQWESRCEKVIAELAVANGVLCFDSLQALLRTGGSEVGNSLAGFFVPYLEHRQLQIVAEATPDELSACRNLFPAFVDTFQIINVDLLDSHSSLAVLEHHLLKLDARYRIEHKSLVCDVMHRLFKRFQPYASLPGAAIPFAERLWAKCAKLKGESPIVTTDFAYQGFCEKTGLPDFILRDELRLTRGEILEYFKENIVGQEAACDAVADVVTLLKSGLVDPMRPLGVLLFCGPTGVGKTELAKTLARYLFKDEQGEGNLIRLDMSEYSGLGAAERLMGTLDREPSAFLKQVRQQPFSVVLLDEIEKASADVFDLLLGVLDEGRIKDRFGQTTFFRSSVIIMTSNLGVSSKHAMGFGEGKDHDFEKEVLNFFRPEFYNRLSRVVSFHPLTKSCIEKITTIELSAFARREGFLKRDIALQFDESVLRSIVDCGFDSRFGARPLQRAIEEKLANPLANYLVEHPDVRSVALDCSMRDEKLSIAKVQ